MNHGQSQALEEIMLGKQVTAEGMKPGVIIDFDRAESTCTVQISIRKRATLPSQHTGIPVTSQQTPSLLFDVPIYFMTSVDFCFSLDPVGSRCMLISSDRILDDWWQSGDEVVDMNHSRTRNSSDYVAVVGLVPKPLSVPSVGDHGAGVHTLNGDYFTGVDKEHAHLIAPGSSIVSEQSQATMTADDRASMDVGATTITADGTKSSLNSATSEVSAGSGVTINGNGVDVIQQSITVFQALAADNDVGAGTRAAAAAAVIQLTIAKGG